MRPRRPISESARALLKSVGSNVHRRRLSLGLKLDGVAISARVTPAYLRRLEAGEADPPLDLLARLAETLDTDATSLLADPTTPESAPTSKSV